MFLYEANKYLREFKERRYRKKRQYTKNDDFSFSLNRLPYYNNKIPATILQIPSTMCTSHKKSSKETSDLIIFTEETFNEKLLFCAVVVFFMNNSKSKFSDESISD